MVVGENTLFPGATSRSIREVQDGLSNTVMVVPTSGADIVWCEPRDLEFDTMSFLLQDPEFQGISSEGMGPVPVGYGDGSVQSLPEDISEGELQSMILINDQ